MKSSLLKIVIVVIILLPIGTNTAKAYDFWIVNSDGDTLCYNITSATNHTVAITYKNDNDDYCYQISGALNIPSSVTYNGVTYSVTSIDSYAFIFCSDLTTVTIPNSVTMIGEQSFAECSRLSTVILPNSVTMIGDGAFGGCRNLSLLTIPNNVTVIGKYTFCGCKLASITIPNSIKNIENGAFYACTNLTSIISMQTTPPSIATSDFYPAFYEVSSTIPVYVPCYSVSAYHSSDWGSKFSNIKGFSSDTTITAHINQGEIYTLNDFNADSTGVYVNATENADGCYALKILNLTVDSTIGLEYVSNNDNQFSALIYPNPATNNATLKIENLKDKAQVEVYNIQGR